jgi:1,4-alpha-glucan branching enzyme
VEQKRQRITFRLFAPEAQEVYLVSNINAWTPSAHEMRKESSGFWQKTLLLPEGVYQYYFIVDGEWREDPECKERLEAQFGKTCVVRVSAINNLALVITDI